MTRCTRAACTAGGTSPSRASPPRSFTPKGDANWLDHESSFMATVDASRVFTLLGATGLPVASDMRSAKMPPVNQGLLDGQLAWREHDGGHTDAPNWKYFIPWADKFLNYQGVSRDLP